MPKRRVEWIGVKSPLQDDRISLRKMLGLYTNDEEVLLESVAIMVAPLIRQHLSTAREKTERDGYSHTYLWGPRWYVCEMEDIDADRLFKHDPDEYEFRDLDNPDHDERQPIVPWPLINKMLYRIMQEARNGPGVVLASEVTTANRQEADRILDQWAQERQERVAERGLIVPHRRGR